MRRKVKIKCKTCGKRFLPKSEKNIFCERKCFKKDFYHRKKAEELQDKKFPVFLCPSCNKKIEIDFDPVIESLRWSYFSCPACNVLMINVSENIITQDVPIKHS